MQPFGGNPGFGNGAGGAGGSPTGGGADGGSADGGDSGLADPAGVDSDFLDALLGDSAGDLIAQNVPLPTAFGGDADAKAAALSLLADLRDKTGVDLMELLGQLPQPPGPTQTRPGMPVPGEGTSPGLEGLSDEDRTALALELCDYCDRYQEAMLPMVEQEQEIRDAYNMSAGGGQSPGLNSGGDSDLVSEFMLVQVDQITARLVTNIMSVEPFAKVDPVLGSSGYDDARVTEFARKCESFLCSYVLNELDFVHLLPRAINRTVKVGTSVLRLAWETEDREYSFYPLNDGTEHTKTVRVGRVNPKLIENRNIIVWPPTAHNWQRDAEIVGHEAWHSQSSWRRLAKSWKLSKDDIDRIEARGSSRDETGDREQIRHGVDQTKLDDQKLVSPQVKLTELWCNLWLPDPINRVTRFQVILHRDTRQILWIGPNKHQSRKHPYFPIRYKWADLSAWGKGVGHEAINCWAADTALWQLSMENLAAGAFNIIIRNAAQVHQTQNRPIRPGMEVTSADPANDFVVRSMGGDAAGLPEARGENEERLKKSTGTPDVAMGMGDSTMKSGAGTGSTMALIEQAGMKIRYIDNTIRTDLSDALAFVLELVCQFGNEGVFYNVVGEKDAQVLERMRFVPPRGGSIAEMFRIRAMAPNAATSNEARRNNMMVIWGFAQQAVQVLDAYAQQALADNPAGMQRWRASMAGVMHELMRRVVELHDIPGMMSMFPTGLPTPTPEDEQLNDANAQIQQLMQQLDGLQKQLNVLTGGGANPQHAATQPMATGAPPAGATAPGAPGAAGPPPGGASPSGALMAAETP